MIFPRRRAPSPVSVHGLLLANRDAAGAVELPDADEQTTPWAPGARDGVLTHHWGGTADAAEVDRVVAAVLSGDAARVEEALTDVRMIAAVDAVLDRVRAEATDHRAVYDLGHSLATGSARREPVKLGIALLGLFDASNHADELRLLARHDEFTLFALLALMNWEDNQDVEAEAWAVARDVTGWGRVHAVERLANTENPEIRRWILREGLRSGR